MALHAYASVERQIFQYDAEDRNGNNFVESADAAEYLKVVLSQRFAVFDIPNAYLFFPPELGGLGLKPASLALLLMGDLAPESASSLLDKFRCAEHSEYLRSWPAKDGEKLTPSQWQQRTNLGLRRTPAFGFDDYTKWGEEFHYGYKNELVHVYSRLLDSPPVESSLYENTGLEALWNGPHHQGTLRDIARGSFPDIGSYWRRVILLYCQEAMERLGSLKLVDMDLLPMGKLDHSKEGH